MRATPEGIVPPAGDGAVVGPPLHVEAVVVPKGVGGEGARGGGGGPERAEEGRGEDAAREDHGCHGLLTQVLQSCNNGD